MNARKNVAGKSVRRSYHLPHIVSPSPFSIFNASRHGASSASTVLIFRFLWAVFFAWYLTACTTGPMRLHEVHYYAVPDGTHTNYYRLKVFACTSLGDAQYRSGWFPANAVDSLFGGVTADDNASAYEARRGIEKQILDKIIATNEAWLDEASKPNPDEEKLIELMQARRRVLAYPRIEGEPFPGAMEIQYNPAKGVAILRADEKLIFLLSSNPNEVVGNIANFAENEKTVSSVNQLGTIIAERVKADIAAEEAVENINKKAGTLIDSQISSTLTVLEGKVTKLQAINEIDTLLSVINAVQP